MLDKVWLSSNSGTALLFPSLVWTELNEGSAWNAYKIIPVSAGDHYMCWVEGSKGVKTCALCCRDPDQGLTLTWLRAKDVFNSSPRFILRFTKRFLLLCCISLFIKHKRQWYHWRRGRFWPILKLKWLKCKQENMLVYDRKKQQKNKTIQTVSVCSH